MEQQFNTPNQVKEPTITQEEKMPKAPLLVIIIAWLMLLGGIGKLLMVLPFLLISPALGILQLLIAVGIIATSFGLRRMRRWVLYVFTAITVLGVGISSYSFLTSPTKEIEEFVDAGIYVLVLVYLWAISKKFV